MNVRCLSKVSQKEIRGRVFLVRVDLNIEAGEEKNAYRIKATLPTLRYLLEHHAKIVLMSHRNRPHFSAAEIRNPNLEIRKKMRAFSLRPFAGILSKKLGTGVKFVPHFDFEKIEIQIKEAKPKSIFLLENLRFIAGEEKNDSKLAAQLASLGDVFVNDAFAVSHRADASIAAITKCIPSYAGLLLEEEIINLDRAMKEYGHPLTIILGGAKISDKVGVMKYFWNKADHFLVGGGPANTFFAVQGIPMGKSLVDTNAMPLIRKYVGKKKVVLPCDVESDKGIILDIGPETVKYFSEIITNSNTIIWNGPPGFFEKKGFESGTKEIWKAIFKNKRAHIVVGGGETVTSGKLISNFKFQISNSRNVFLSTGGGAMLDYLSGKKLPGIEALRR